MKMSTFGRVLYDELVAILKNIKTEHRKDKTTSDGAMVEQPDEGTGGCTET